MEHLSKLRVEFLELLRYNYAKLSLLNILTSIHVFVRAYYFSYQQVGCIVIITLNCRKSEQANNTKYGLHLHTCLHSTVLLLHVYIICIL